MKFFHYKTDKGTWGFAIAKEQASVLVIFFTLVLGFTWDEASRWEDW